MTNDTQNAPVLPQDTAHALSEMIAITRKVIESYENETNAVALGNDAVFLESTKAKMDAGALYQKAATEFMDREKEFAAYGGPMMQELVNLQQKLKAEAQINMNFLEQVEQRARATVEGGKK